MSATALATAYAISTGIKIVSSIFGNADKARKQRREAEIVARKTVELQYRKKVNKKLIENKGAEAVSSSQTVYALSGIDTSSGSALVELANLESIVLDEVGRSGRRFDENIRDLTSQKQALLKSADDLTSFSRNAVSSALTASASYLNYQVATNFREEPGKDKVGKIGGN